MQEVAAQAGVSQTTVSHVMNGSRRIAPDTEAKVRAAIASLGYVHDSVARSLRTGSTATVGVAISALSNPYFAEVVGAIERAVTAEGRSLMLVDTHDEPDRELQAVQGLLGRRCDGIILAPSAEPGATIGLVTRQRTPLVLIDRVPAHAWEAVDAIGVENREATAQLVDHVVGLGHRRLAFVSGLAGLPTSAERLEGFRIGLRRNGISDTEVVVDGGSTEATSRTAVVDLLAAGPRPEVLVTGNNAMTIGAMRALTELGLDVPGDLALVGFDDFPWAPLFRPRLTVVAQPLMELGARAAQLLAERIADPNLPARVERLAPTLVVRESGGGGEA